MSKSNTSLISYVLNFSSNIIPIKSLTQNKIVLSLLLQSQDCEHRLAELDAKDGGVVVHLDEEVEVLVAGGEVAGQGGKRLVQGLASCHLSRMAIGLQLIF